MDQASIPNGNGEPEDGKEPRVRNRDLLPGGIVGVVILGLVGYWIGSVALWIGLGLIVVPIAGVIGFARWGDDPFGDELDWAVLFTLPLVFAGVALGLGGVAARIV